MGTFAPLPALPMIIRTGTPPCICKAGLQSWIAKLEEDNRLIVHAAANAQRAVDLIMGTTFEDEAGSSQETEEEAAAGAFVESCSSAA
jgi:antirestriction protein ArdC